MLFQSGPTSRVTAPFMVLCALQTTYAQGCSPNSISNPRLPGGQILSLSASLVSNYTVPSPDLLGVPPGVPTVASNFCNVTITHTHPGWNDTIHTYIWLPASTNWNGRLQGVGGGGFAGLQNFAGLVNAVDNGYVAVGSDLGHVMDSANASTWALDTAGKVSFDLLQDFASIALNDATILAKAVTKSVYGKGPNKSYWNGCSTGGRQGLMLAQRYPDAYDGIFAGAPAINWAEFIVAEYWPPFVMQQLKTFPNPCILSYINAATTQACDALDGAIDGIIANPFACKFDPHTLVGKSVNCTGTMLQVTYNDATIAQETWRGMQSTSNTSLWYGLLPGAEFSQLANTVCTTPTNCTLSPFEIATEWITRFVRQDPSYDLTAMTLADYESSFYQSMALYDNVISTANPDLSAFKKRGGKLMHWHGLADVLIFPQGSEQYYKRVQELDPELRDFYRYFEAPGVGHCVGGPGAAPTDAEDLKQLVAWVEEGTAPESLTGVSYDGLLKRNICPWPLVQKYHGGNVNESASFTCEKGF